MEQESLYFLSKLHPLLKMNSINVSAKLFFESIENPFLTKLMLFLTDIGSPTSIFLYCLVLVMIMWLHKKYTHMIQFIVTIGATALIAVSTKEIVRLQRPSQGIITEIGYSFASAHAMIAIVFFTLILYSYKNHFKSAWIRTCFNAICVSLVLIIGCSRIYLGVHYATDVLAGFLIGIIIASISILMYEKHLRNMIQ